MESLAVPVLPGVFDDAITNLVRYRVIHTEKQAQPAQFHAIETGGISSWGQRFSREIRRAKAIIDAVGPDSFNQIIAKIR
jgi:hypothetical protein